MQYIQAVRLKTAVVLEKGTGFSDNSVQILVISPSSLAYLIVNVVFIISLPYTQEKSGLS